MKNLTDKLFSFITLKKNLEQTEAPSFDFVKSRKNILKELILSKQSGNVIGVYSKVLGEGMFLTGVEDIEPMPGTEVVVFSQYDFSGKILGRTRIELEDIQMVCPFNKPYRNPLFFDGSGEKTHGFYTKTATLA